MRRRARAVVALMFIVLAMASCRQVEQDGNAGGALAAGTFEDEVIVDGRQRTYRVHVPPSLTGQTGVPVVIGLHGGGGNGEQFEQQSHLSTVADRAGFVAVYPYGSGGTRLLTWNAGACCAYARDQGIDDVAFIAAMLDALGAKYHTDPARVYVTGFSNGAMMSYRLACELADRVTAIAPVAGALNVDDCRPSRPLPVLAIHGTADEAVPYDGGPPARKIPGAGTWQNQSVSYAVSFWINHDGCPATPAESRDGAVVRTSYAPCADGLEVTLYTIDGGGHAWPGGVKGREAADVPPPTPDASSVIWDFFARFPVH